jgi:hypothetical protein
MFTAFYTTKYSFFSFFSHHALDIVYKLLASYIACDKYELPDITDTFSFNFSTADSWVRSRIVSGREGGGGSLRGSRLNQPNSMSFFLPLSTYTLNILGLGDHVYCHKSINWNVLSSTITFETFYLS